MSFNCHSFIEHLLEKENQIWSPPSPLTVFPIIWSMQDIQTAGTWHRGSLELEGDIQTMKSKLPCSAEIKFKSSLHVWSKWTKRVSPITGCIPWSSSFSSLVPKDNLNANFLSKTVVVECLKDLFACQRSLFQSYAFPDTVRKSSEWINLGTIEFCGFSS